MLYDQAYVDRRHLLRSYHAWMARRRARLLERYAALCAGDDVLEVGCDTGSLLRVLEARGMRVDGVDVSVDAAQAHPRARVAQADALPFADDSFDCCVSSHVIEHMHEPKGLFEEASRVLLRGGRLVLWYPWELFRGMTVLPELLASGRPLSLAREYHVRRFRPSMLRAHAERAGLSELASRWCWFGPVPEYMTIYVKR